MPLEVLTDTACEYPYSRSPSLAAALIACMPFGSSKVIHTTLELTGEVVLIGCPSTVTANCITPGLAPPESHDLSCTVTVPDTVSLRVGVRIRTDGAVGDANSTCTCPVVPSQVAVTVAVPRAAAEVSVTWAVPEEPVVTWDALRVPASVLRSTSLFSSGTPSRSVT